MEYLEKISGLISAKLEQEALMERTQIMNAQMSSCLLYTSAVDMLEELPATIVKRVLQNASPDTRKLINQFLKYPENSAGSIMTAEYVGLKKRMTVEQAFAYIRKHGVDKETIYTCYVMDDKRHLEGVVTVKDLLMNPYETVIGEIMDTRVIKAVTTEDREEVVDTFNKYDLLSLPVVDQEDRLVGIITVDDAVAVSYTHLDVYKRQSTSRSTTFWIRTARSPTSTTERPTILTSR